MRKKLLTACAVGVLALGLASCNNSAPADDGGKDPVDTGKRISLVYSGTASDKTFNEELIQKFKDYKKAQGDTNEYVIDYVSHGPDKVDSEIIDWSAANAPDVYEAAPDKVAILYAKGALAKVSGKYKTFIDEEINDFGKANATFNENYYAYPYTGDNTYYLQYDKSVLTENDVKSVEALLAKANTLGKKVGYNLKEGFWGVGALFTFGADYTISFDEDGKASSIAATWDQDEGLMAAKAIYKISSDPAWQNTMEAPTESNNLIACMAGTWDIGTYKDALGDNYGCAVMPTVTVANKDGIDVTKNLGAFVGGKLLAVNPLRSGTDTDRLTAAHELAMYLAGTDCQLARFTKNGWGPCSKAALANSAVSSNANMAVLAKQVEFGHEQTSTPAKIWDGAATLVESIVDPTVCDGSTSKLQELLLTFNNTVKQLN